MKTKNTLDYEFQNLKNNLPIMDFNGSISLSEWKEKAYSKLSKLLGLPLEKCDSEFEIEYEKTNENGNLI